MPRGHFSGLVTRRLQWISVAVITGLAISTWRLFAVRRVTTFQQQTSFASQAVAVVTAAYGAFERTLKPTPLQSIPTRFFAFTDDPNIVSKGDWEIETIPYHALPQYKPDFDNDSYVNSMSRNKHPHNLAKFYKMQFFRIPKLQLYRYVIWLDSAFSIVSHDFAKTLVSKLNDSLCHPPSPVAVYEHSRRDNYYREACTSKKDHRWKRTWLRGIRQPYQNLTRQCDFYMQQGLNPNHYREKYERSGLWECGMMTWNMTHPKARVFLDNWYLQNLNHTTQDQVGFPYAAWISDVIPCSILPRKLNQYNNGLVHWHDHGN